MSAAAAALLLSGCFDPNYPPGEGGFACVKGECPSQYVCSSVFGAPRCVKVEELVGNVEGSVSVDSTCGSAQSDDCRGTLYVFLERDTGAAFVLPAPLVITDVDVSAGKAVKYAFKGVAAAALRVQARLYELGGDQARSLEKGDLKGQSALDTLEPNKTLTLDIKLDARQ